MPKSDFIHLHQTKGEDNVRLVVLLFLPILFFVLFFTFALISESSSENLAARSQSSAVLGETQETIDK